MDPDRQVRLNRLFAILIVICALALGFSFGVEKFLGWQPCMLCTWQRIPYLLIATNACLGIFTSIKKELFRIIQILLLISCLLGAFHTAVQFGKLKDPCSKKRPLIEEVSDYKSLLMQSSCSRASFDLFGLPLSLYNCLLSLTLLKC